MNEEYIQSLLNQKVDCLDLDKTRSVARDLQEALNVIRNSHSVAQGGSKSDSPHAHWIQAEPEFPGKRSEPRCLGYRGERVFVYDENEGTKLLKVRNLEDVQNRKAIIYRLSKRSGGEIHFYGQPDYQNPECPYRRVRALSSGKSLRGYDPLPTIYLRSSDRLRLLLWRVEWLFILLPQSDGDSREMDL